MSPEELSTFITTNVTKPSRVYQLHHDDSLNTLFDFISTEDLSPQDILFAFDLDQTVKELVLNEQGGKSIALRGGEQSLIGMNRLYEMGYHAIIVTAQEPHPEAVEGVVVELREIGIAHVFDVECFELEGVYRYWNGLGESEGLDDEKLLQKLALLLTLKTDRFPADLVRLGSVVKIEDDKLYYHLIKDKKGSNDYGDWGPLFELTREENSNLCAVATWEAYLERFERDDDMPDRTFLEDGDLFNIEKMEGIVLSALMESGLDEKYTRSLIKPKETIIFDDIKLGTDGGKIFASKYNKPEAIEYYLKVNNMTPKIVVFVDDNTDNVMNVYFKYLNETDTKAYSFWYTPPPTGKDEHYSPLYRDIMNALIDQHMADKK